MFELGKKTRINGLETYVDSNGRYHNLLGPASGHRGYPAYFIHGCYLAKANWEKEVESIYKAQVHLLKQKIVKCWVLAKLINDADLIYLTSKYEAQMEKLLKEPLDEEVNQALVFFLVDLARIRQETRLKRKH